MDATRVLRVLLPRATDDPTSEFLKLLQDPFSSQLQQNSVWAALGSSVGITAAFAICFSFLRPYNSVVYAPKLKHADEKHAPPPLGKGVFAWIGPLWKTTEQDLVNLVGMDAAIFMRFTRMCRDMLLVLSVLGCCILIPVNWTHTDTDTVWLSRVTPTNVWADAHWATVVTAWLFTIVVCGFLWWNYRKVLLLRRQYFESEEYQQSLHARTLMLYDIPKNFASDEGIARIIDGVVPSSSFSRTAIARDVKILPRLIEEHSKTVHKLEKVLAIYLKDPNNLPAARPVCLPSKKDPSYSTYPKGQKLDAIEYLTQRIKSLELEIKEIRQSVDKRGTMPYGFASYVDITEAHSIAYVCRKKKPHGATVTLAPRPNDIIWDNMPLSSPTRARRRLWNNLWVTILTFLWIAPNAMIAIFLVNLANLGHVWPAFQTSLSSDYTFWSIVQGIASPAITSLIYLLLPIIFRRMSIRAGDQTKTGRERHVVSKLYSFFVFNNLFVFSGFSAIWSFTAGVVQRTSKGTDAWQAIVSQNFGLTVFLSLCSVSPFWITWLLQRQLGAAIDLAQLWTLFYSFVMRKLSSPTPRELIELTAPPPFDYASYYNYFLFYATVTLCYAPIQPLVLPAAAMYFCIDVALKKYLLLYIFVTKTESGGMFWRILFNRFIFGTMLSQLVVFLVVWVRGDGYHTQAFSVAPLPFLLVAFKFYCSRVFDDKIHYYSTRNLRRNQTDEGLNVKEQSLKNDRLAARFGHPALYKPLVTPMVHAKAQNLLASVYQGRLTDGRDAGTGDSTSVSGYSDAYVLDNMASGKVGKAAASLPGFEVVPESRLDFEFYKNRDEFAADHGAGELFGRPEDMMRPGTPGTIGSGGSGSRPGTPVGGMGFAGSRRPFSPQSEPRSGTAYAHGYAPPPQQPTGYAGQSLYSSPPATAIGDIPRSRSPLYSLDNGSGSDLVRNAAGMPISTTPGVPEPRDRSLDSGTSRPFGGLGIVNPRALPPGMLGGGPRGYGGLPQDDDLVQSPPAATQPTDPMQYDYFRGGARRGTRDPGGANPGAATRNGSGMWGGN
ncbi:protein OSCA1 [Diplogelasinospora grovesii]|uniref:Protein OSCA1 n=1 Tax=Diplogelasinospora grovesii TaxID=303347 RepID=A0AAN6S7V1_9PEZI|nr:protein OSCA1 [Diplogelasinospora grovesii]